MGATHANSSAGVIGYPWRSVICGTLVADPYRPLEDTDAPESRRWIDAENSLTEAFLETVNRPILVKPCALRARLEDP